MGSRSFTTKGHPNGEVYTDYNGNTRIALYDGTAAAVARGNVRRIGYDSTNNRLAAVAISTGVSQQQILVAAEPCAAGKMSSYYIKGSNIYVLDSTYFTTGTYTADYGVSINNAKVTCTGAAYASNTNEFGAVTTAGTSSCYIDMFGLPVFEDLVIGKSASTTAGQGMTLSASKLSALSIFTDDGAAAIGTSYNVCPLNVRMSVQCTTQTEAEFYAIRSRLGTHRGAQHDHNDAAVLGSREVTGTLCTFTGASGDNIHSGVEGRLGITVTGTTVSATGRLAGLAAISSITDGYVTVTSGGILAGVFVGKHTSMQNWNYGIYIDSCKQGAYFSSDAGTIASGDAIGVNIVHTGTMSSDEGLVGIQSVVTTAGTAGLWAAAIYAKTVQGTTKNVTGYLCAAELELQLGTMAAVGLSNFAVLVLNSSVATLAFTPPTAIPYIMCRDYGVTTGLANCFVRFVDAATSNTSLALLFSTNTATAASHSIRCMVGATPYYILCSNTVV